MEVFIRDEDKEKYESFSLMGYYHTNRKGEENTDLKVCLIQDIYASDDENLPRLTVKSLDHHDAEIKVDERKKADEYIENRLLTYKNRISFLEEQNKMLLSYVVKLFNSQNTITTTILDDLKQKLEEMKGEKDE